LKRFLIISILIILAVTSGISICNLVASSENSFIETACVEGLVEKTPGEQFTVQVAFKNKGKAEGTWSVNVAFEGDWSWEGTAKNLTLCSYELKTLKWNGSVSSDAPIDSTARLVVYFDGDFEAQDWWIRVISPAELTILYSKVI
jgi:hypothetical protein